MVSTLHLSSLLETWMLEFLLASAKQWASSQSWHPGVCKLCWMDVKR